jgi:hypothetical protein
MPRWQRVYVSACAGIAAFALAYALTDYAHIPHVYYLPVDRSFRVADRMAGLPMGYVGLWLWGVVAGAVAAAVAWFAAGRARRPLGERALGLALAWTATAFVFAAGYFVWNNWP